MEKFEGSWDWGGCLESGTGAGMLSITSGAAAAGVGTGVVVLAAFAAGCVVGGWE